MSCAMPQCVLEDGGGGGSLCNSSEGLVAFLNIGLEGGGGGGFALRRYSFGQDFSSLRDN